MVAVDQPFPMGFTCPLSELLSYFDTDDTTFTLWGIRQGIAVELDWYTPPTTTRLLAESFYSAAVYVAENHSEFDLYLVVPPGKASPFTGPDAVTPNCSNVAEFAAANPELALLYPDPNQPHTWLAAGDTALINQVFAQLETAMASYNEDLAEDEADSTEADSTEGVLPAGDLTEGSVQSPEDVSSNGSSFLTPDAAKLMDAPYWIQFADRASEAKFNPPEQIKIWHPSGFERSVLSVT